jgi:hypothetical protein
LQTAQIIQRRVTDAEIVERNMYAEAFQPGENGLTSGYILHERRLSNLEHEQTGVEA